MANLPNLPKNLLPWIALGGSGLAIFFSIPKAAENFKPVDNNRMQSVYEILADKETDEILGVHMIGARVADLIAEAVTAMEFRASAEDISRMSHSHPTYAEAIKEAALAATENRPIHI